MKQIIKIVSSPKIFVYTIIWLMVLVVLGTLAQRDIGLYASQQKYFSANITWLGGIIPVLGGRITMVIMLAKTAGISDDYYDAANIDGASQFQKDVHITAPLIKSTFFLCIILAVIFNLRQFEYVYLMTAGGPANKTSVLVVYIWNELSVQRLGRGNAAGVIMIAIGAVLLLTLRKLLKSETYN